MNDPRVRRSATWIVESIILMGFIALVVWFGWAAPEPTIPPAASTPVSEEDISNDPVRGLITHEAITTIGQFTRNCNECHSLFESAATPASRLTQHKHIALDHGLNDNCYNCHDREDRSRLALRWGNTVPFADVPQLCAKCHGPTYRDWQQGMHGRSMGSWDPMSSQRVRLKCSDCHDPHAPAYAPMAPMPGPNTLRMGDVKGHGQSTPLEEADPLRKWRGVMQEQEEHESPAEHES